MLLSDNESETSWTSEEVETQNKYIGGILIVILIGATTGVFYFLIKY